MTQTIPALWGAVLMNGSQLETGCLQHWFHSLESPADCGMPAGTQTLALAWDRSRLTTAPDWQDFWDIARHPGRRGLYFGARTTLEITLLADGVAPESVYTLLSSPSGVERAFHKLDLLRPYIIWWRTPSDAHHIMQQRSALMTSAPLEEITPFSHVKTEPTFGTQMNHSLKISLFWAIPQNVSNDAEKNIINTIKTIDHFEKNTPTATVQNTLNVDDAFWKENGPALEKRFLNWFSRNTPQ
nr:extracellular solute-binding protein [Neokomagataea tanensis]